MPAWVWVPVVAAAALVIDRLLLAMEARGWIYYRTRSARRGAAAVVLPFDEVFHPSSHVLVAERQSSEVRAAQQDSGDGPGPAG
ncbi:hypothetical protein [Propionibacterium australiense]|uniref:Uncharacterized protein n=1 Tax=Propionibacterium australiense TaxID=119981 RepID=A0A383S9S9_9ACTN|nr:hypothetical protein [Propionibacterium australiense]RLP09530.1 hypothetical protein D9T14_07185 [Propionibacterium australiense]RLP09892.1 hypothetical protein D7U36_06860 [Propionibacterium australiense]SYZ34174.1 Hypothetical protein PROPAUS_2177 [Propionibacterium australiense]VEH89405.1 Uncharacterised protein [Propionibacterium australiense]